jgi:hypothetical protein
MLEQIRRARWQATAGEQTSIGEPSQSYIKVTPIRDLIEQLIRKFAAEHGTDLRDFLGRRPESVEPRGERGMQRGRDRQLRPRTGGEESGDAGLPIGAFEHRFGQFLDKQRDPVGALHDLCNEGGFERGMGRQVLHQRSALALAEPFEFQQRNMRLTAPTMLELRSVGDNQQNRQALHHLDREGPDVGLGRRAEPAEQIGRVPAVAESPGLRRKVLIGQKAGRVRGQGLLVGTQRSGAELRERPVPLDRRRRHQPRGGSVADGPEGPFGYIHRARRPQGQVRTYIGR